MTPANEVVQLITKEPITDVLSAQIHEHMHNDGEEAKDGSQL
jgi:hypothetical protein